MEALLFDQFLNLLPEEFADGPLGVYHRGVYTTAF